MCFQFLIQAENTEKNVSVFLKIKPSPRVHTVYCTVPFTLMLYIPKPSTWPLLVLKIIESSQQKDMVKEYPESKIVSTGSLLKYTCVLVNVSTCAPKHDSMLDTIFLGSMCLCTIGNGVCLI